MGKAPRDVKGIKKHVNVPAPLVCMYMDNATRHTKHGGLYYYNFNI